MKKIIVIVVSFMFILGFLFGFVPYKMAHAETFKYDGEITTDSSSLPDYSITSIESLTYNSHWELHLNYHFTSSAALFFLNVPSSSPGFYSIMAQNIEFNFNTNKNTNNPWYNNLTKIRVHSSSADSPLLMYAQSSDYHRLLTHWTDSYVDITFIFDFSNFSPSTEDLNKFVDMQSNDNLYSCGFGVSPDNFLLKFLNYMHTGDFVEYSGYNGSYFTSIGYSNGSVVPTAWNINYSNSYTLRFSLNSGGITNKDYTFWLNDLVFSIYRPTTRVNNSLVIYNYNYGFLNGVVNLDYTLRKNNDYFTTSCIGGVGMLPNSYYITISTPEIANKVFDEYITFRINQSGHRFSNGYVRNLLVFENNNIMFDFGFDFNFTYYTEPFIASNGSYNYDFNKPSYKWDKIEFSLTPPKLHIPILSWVENACIYLIFYCPLISDLLELVHLDLFLGGLINILEFILGLEIGQFLISCIAFIIFFAILKSFMPIVMSAGSGAIQDVKDIYNDSQFAYNRKEKIKRKLQRKEQRKQEKYRTKVMNSSVKKRKK